MISLIPPVRNAVQFRCRLQLSGVQGHAPAIDKTWNCKSENTVILSNKLFGFATGEAKRLLNACCHEITRKELQESLELKSEENFRNLYSVPAPSDDSGCPNHFLSFEISSFIPFTL